MFFICFFLNFVMCKFSSFMFWYLSVLEHNVFEWDWNQENDLNHSLVGWLVCTSLLPLN